MSKQVRKIPVQKELDYEKYFVWDYLNMISAYFNSAIFSDDFNEKLSDVIQLAYKELDSLDCDEYDDTTIIEKGYIFID